MILKELRFCDFLVFPGEQQILLPSGSGAGNLVVVLAPNNSGKTSIVRALKFLFYGDLLGGDEKSAHRLVNDRTRAAAIAGREISSWVEATYERDGVEKCVRRTIKAKKDVNTKQWRTVEIILEKVARGRDIRFERDDRGVFQREFKTLVPEMLFDAFFFKGEPLDGKLLGGVGNIRQALAAFLHEERWKEAQLAAEQARDSITRELTRLSEKNAEYSKKLYDEEMHKKELRKLQEVQSDQRAKLDSIAGEMAAVEAAIERQGKQTDVDKVVEQLKVSREGQRRAQEQRNRAETETTRLVQKSQGVPFLIGALPRVAGILSDLRRDNVLPADVTEAFVDRVVSAPSCLCGRNHDDSTRAAWRSYQKKTLAADLNQGLTILLGAVQSNAPQGYASRSQHLCRDLQVEQAQRAECIQHEKGYGDATREAEDKLKISPVEQISKLHGESLRLQREKRALERGIDDYNRKIAVSAETVRRVEGECRKLTPPGTAEGSLGNLASARKRAEDLSSLLRASREILQSYFHRVLQDSVTKYYDSNATDGSRGYVNRASLMPAIIKADGVVQQNIGGGQSQLLALSYIVSLAGLRKELHAQMQALGIGLGKLDDQSFVLDSPFANTDSHYSKAIIHFLLDHAPRSVVVLMARQQWNLVRDVLEPKTTKVLGFKLHSPQASEANVNPEDFLFTVAGRTESLLGELPADELAYTQIIPLL